MNMKLWKHTIAFGCALGVALSVLPMNSAKAEGFSNIPVVAYQTITNVTYLEEKTKNEIPDVPSVKLPSLKYMQQGLDTKPKENIVWKDKSVNTMDQLIQLMNEVYTELPQKVIIKSDADEKLFRTWMQIYESSTIPDKNLNLNTLANYSLKKTGFKQYTLTDKTHSKYQAKQIEASLNDFSEEFAKSIQDLSSEQKLHAIYNYIFDQFSYNASGYSKMLVGNAPNYEMACNGFSRFFYQLATHSGIEARIVKSEDHFYNQIKTEDGWVIIDLTTDILLKTKHGATGLSQEEYLKYVSGVGFYWALPINAEKVTPHAWSEEEKAQFLNINESFAQSNLK